MKTKKLIDVLMFGINKRVKQLYPLNTDYKRGQFHAFCTILTILENFKKREDSE